MDKTSPATESALGDGASTRELLARMLAELRGLRGEVDRLHARLDDGLPRAPSPSKAARVVPAKATTLPTRRASKARPAASPPLAATAAPAPRSASQQALLRAVGIPPEKTAKISAALPLLCQAMAALPTHGRPKALADLAKLGADLEEREAGPHGRTPVMWAIAHGDPYDVDALLSAGADAHAATLSGKTAIMHACQWGCPEALRALLARGADPDILWDGHHYGEPMAMSAAHFATLHSKAKELLTILCDAGADLTRRGPTPAAFAKARGSPDGAHFFTNGRMLALIEANSLRKSTRKVRSTPKSQRECRL